MSEEYFKRSEVGRDANFLHKHGGQDAHEARTERESLENAIEALNDSEETENLVDIENNMKSGDIEEIKKPEIRFEPAAKKIDEEKSAKIDELLKRANEAPVAAATATATEKKEEPINNWKAKAESQTFMTIDSIQDPKVNKKGGAGWKIATVLFLLLAVAGCGTAAYLFFTDGKTNIMGRTIESYETGKKKDSKTPSVNTSEEEKFDAEKNLIDVATLNKVTDDPGLRVEKLEYSTDGKYMIALMTDSNAYSVWYKKVEKGSTWTMLQGGQAFASCSDYTEEQKNLMTEFKTFDDDLGSRNIGCYPDESQTSIFPE